jgi:hypothetical protein
LHTTSIQDYLSKGSLLRRDIVALQYLLKFSEQVRTFFEITEI